VLEPVLWSVALPVAVVAAILAVCWWPAGEGGRLVNRALIACALACAAVGSFVASVGLPSWPPPQRWHGLVWLFGALAALGVVDALLRPAEWAGRVLIAGAAGLAAAWLLSLPGVSPLAIGLAVGVSTLLVSLLDAEGGRGAAVLVGLWAGGAALSMLILVAASMSVSLMAGAVSAAAAAALLMGVLLRGRAVTRIGGGGATAGGLIAALALTGWSYDYDVVPLWAWWCAMAGFPIACMLEIGPLRKWQGLASIMVRAFAMAAPPVTAIVLNRDAIQGAFGG